MQSDTTWLQLVPTWITAIAALGGVGVLFIAIAQLKTATKQIAIASNQLNATIKQISADHARSRNEKAIELLVQWSTNLNRRGSIARKFAEKLNFEQSKCLFAEESFEVDIGCVSLVVGCLSEIDEERLDEWEQAKIVSLSQSEAAEIRWEVVSYLNTLETILVAWRHNVADREIITEQFGYLVSPKDGLGLLSNFRQAAGDRSTFPGISDFVEAVSKHKNPITPGKPEIA
jgi:hypothetical protein